jgi:hypothetical protein
MECYDREEGRISDKRTEKWLANDWLTSAIGLLPLVAHTELYIL